MDTTRDITYRTFKLNAATQGDLLDTAGTAADATTDVITCLTAHGMVAGDRMSLLAVTGGAPLVAGKTYYLVAPVTTTTFKLALSLNGAPINLTSNSTVFVAAKGDPPISFDAGRGIGKGIAGSVVDSWDFSDVDVRQFLEARSQQDGMDAGDVTQGARRLRMAGTLYAKTRALLFDVYWDFRATMNPVLAQRESPADKGYLPLYFSTPTARIEDYPDLTIPLRCNVLPRAHQVVWQRDQQGGVEGDSLAIPWQATFLMKDPLIYAQTAQNIDLSAGGTIAGNFVNRGKYISYLNILVGVTATGGSLVVNVGGATFTITIPASTGNRDVIYDGKEKVLTIREGGIETVRYDLLTLGTAFTHPVIPPGSSPYTFTFSGVAVQAGSKAFFYETYA